MAVKRGFTIHHNGPNTALAGKPHASCVAFWEGIRRYHMETKGWSDIAYSFGICHHGIRLEGRGWDQNQFANGTDVVGDFDGKDSEWYSVFVTIGWNDDAAHPIDEEPSKDMIEGVAVLIDEGRDTERCGLRVLPHNAFKLKRCPGAIFTALAKRWDNVPFPEISEPLDPTVEDHEMTTYAWFEADDVDGTHLYALDGAKANAITTDGFHWADNLSKFLSGGTKGVVLWNTREKPWTGDALEHFQFVDGALAGK